LPMKYYFVHVHYRQLAPDAPFIAANASKNKKIQ
jgi:hypothetical protein